MWLFYVILIWSNFQIVQGQRTVPDKSNQLGHACLLRYTWTKLSTAFKILSDKHTMSLLCFVVILFYKPKQHQALKNMSSARRPWKRTISMQVLEPSLNVWKHLSYTVVPTLLAAMVIIRDVQEQYTQLHFLFSWYFSTTPCVWMHNIPGW